jgi:hypothetical protein
MTAETAAINDAFQELGTRREQVRQLRAALHRFGIHRRLCPASHRAIPVMCTCGYRAALDIGADLPKETP